MVRVIKPKPLQNKRSRAESIGRWIFGSVPVFIVTIFVTFLVVACLWISAAAIVNKIELARGASQIIDIVDLTRHMAEIEHTLGTYGREDILGRLANTEQVKVTGDSDGLKTVANPWGGTMVVYTTSGAAFRIENAIPAPICARIIGLLTKNISSLGLQKIDVKGGGPAWRQIYVKNSRNQINQNEISAGCRNDSASMVLALTFSLR